MSIPSDEASPPFSYLPPFSIGVNFQRKKFAPLLKFFPLKVHPFLSRTAQTPDTGIVFLIDCPSVRHGVIEKCNCNVL